MSTHTQLKAEEVGKRGEALYQGGIRAKVESGNRGKYLSLDIDNGEYVIGTDRLENIHQLREYKPNATIYTVLIGYPAVAAIGSQLRPNTGSEQS